MGIAARIQVLSSPGEAARADGRSASPGAVFVVLLLASLAYNYNFLVIDYVRPFLLTGAGMTLAQTTWLYTAQGVGVLLGSFAAASIVSAIGARRTLVAACAAIAAMTATHELAESFSAWLATRFLVGLALSACYVASTTMLANTFAAERRGRLASINMAAFSIALMSIGALGSAVGADGWRTLLRAGAVGPLAVAVLAAAVLPDDRGRIAALAARESPGGPVRGAWPEMISPALRWRTLGCLAIAGLNFSAYQFYSGFITTYLLTVRHFDASLTGAFVFIDGAGTLAGSALWGFVADRIGRRANATGFLLAPVFIAGVLLAPAWPPLLMALEFGYALCLSCSNAWGAWFAELFPVRLRPMGAALFHGGHIVSLFAPRLVAAVAASGNLVPGMALAPGAFVLAAVIWLRLPETLPRSPRSVPA